LSSPPFAINTKNSFGAFENYIFEFACPPELYEKEGLEFRA
jgi:hypothetical protein